MVRAVRTIKPGAVRQSTWAGARGYLSWGSGRLSAEGTSELIPTAEATPRAGGADKEHRREGAQFSEQQQAGPVPRIGGQKWGQLQEMRLQREAGPWGRRKGFGFHPKSNEKSLGWGGELTGMGYDVFFTVKFPGLLSGACMQGEQAWEQGTSLWLSQDKETRLSQGEAGTGQIQRELSQTPWQVADELDVREG